MIDPRLCDVRNRYNRELVEAFLPAKYPEELRPTLEVWFGGLPPRFSLEKYLSHMRKSFRRLGERDPRGPIQFMSKLAFHTGGEPWAGPIARWMGELLACAYPDEEPADLQRRIDQAMDEPEYLSPTALNLGKALWRDDKLSDLNTYARLSSRLSAHVAVSLYYGKWIGIQVWREAARTSPRASERRSPDAITLWDTSNAHDAIVGAQLERTFGDPARSLPGYPPDHPQAVRVRTEKPRDPGRGQKDRGQRVWSLIFELLPLIRNYDWSSADVWRAVCILRPDMASRVETSKTDQGGQFIRDQVFARIGFNGNAERGRPPTGKGRVPTGFNLARVIVAALHGLPFN